MRDFEKTFTYEPTPDQMKCFEAVENDMVWRSRPMDRLVCGDVGFGKTEVALRAIFRCVANGKQAALLSPTGVLAAQHLKTVLSRMGPSTGSKFNIAILRGGMGKNTKVGRALREQISNGEIDVIVGTHALLSSGLNYKDLGLLVVDEEQRFGVKQKERLKIICNGVDVLTLSATPIPRTLQMSLSGIRDTSTIRSPPPMRKPTITHVQEYNKDTIRDAIALELERGGQCFYVVPRIAQLEEAEKTIYELFPDIRIIQAHGRMPRGGAEQNVAAFAEGDYDVLLATTVIENGVDIPSVNTILINNAQSFGMSTLYQLRGRVGRSSLQGYAYFLHKEDAITEQSAMRLQAMADLHELGSGFDVANRDLEIRGAGSLLGTEQSGMAAKVGFDLYMRMLKKSIRQLRGLDLPMVPRTNVLLPGDEGSLEIGENDDGRATHAFNIPKKYIADEKQRFLQEGAARLAESTSQLVDMTNTWKDQHGPLPPRLQGKLKTLHLHACTRTLGIDLVGFVDNGDGTKDCVLRSPGLRPRHMVHISQFLPRKVPTKGVDVLFPARFAKTEEDVLMKGGQAIDLSILQSNNGDDEEEEWDALDDEEVEAMKEITSAMFLKSLDEVDITDYPCFVIRNMSSIKTGSRVDALLRVLLPASKVVHAKQSADKEKAKVATELRNKREAMKKQKKEQEALTSRRMGYNL
jgi:transcription-repair coupling factor (superfamily II helicase)